MTDNNRPGTGSSDHSDSETVNCLISIHFKSMELIGEIREVIEVIDQVKLKASLANEIAYINMKRDRCSHGIMGIDTIIHFHIEFPNDTQDWSNVMLVQLVIASKLVPSHFTILGQSQIHLHQIANESPFSAIATLSNDNSATIAHVNVDCALNYGILGYGESLQLHSSYKNMEERLQWTTFPRINNPLTSHSTTIRPHSLVSRERNVYNHTITDDLKIPQPPAGSILGRKMFKLQDWILQCRAIKDRHKKMEFIERLSQSSGQHSVHPLNQPTGIIARQTVGGSMIAPY